MYKIRYEFIVFITSLFYFLFYFCWHSLATYPELPSPYCLFSLNLSSETIFMKHQPSTVTTPFRIKIQ